MQPRADRVLDVALPCAHTAPNHIALSGSRGAKNMPARRRPSTRRILPLAICLMATAALATSCNGNQLHPELVPGTAYVKSAGNPPWFTISPDEKWIAFMEVDSTEWRTPESERPPGSFHLVTTSLETHRKTHHSLSSLPGETFTADYSAWQEVQQCFVTRGWLDDRLYVQLGSTPAMRPWICFTPGEVMAERVAPPSEMTCCACPPPRAYEGVLKNRGLKYYFGTAAYRNGVFDNIIYASPKESGGATVDRVRQDNSREQIFDGRRRFKDVVVSDMVVSPDGSYLAVALTTTVHSPIPLPTMRYELHVLDLHSGKHLRVDGSYRLIRGLMWSEDSQRLYYAAVNGPAADGKGDGVFRIRFPH